MYSLVVLVVFAFRVAMVQVGYILSVVALFVTGPAALSYAATYTTVCTLYIPYSAIFSQICDLKYFVEQILLMRASG